jgi:DNA processing protein
MGSAERDWLRLHLTRGLGRTGLMRLLEGFGDAQNILAAPAAAWMRCGVREAVAAAVPPADDSVLERVWRELEHLGVRVVPFCDDEYPKSLRTIADPPALLYVRGEFPPQEGLAVVGARQASEGGRRLTDAVCREIASRGIVITSGLARGIDTAAHRGALEGGGFTVAVLGCGIDRVYPPENAGLFHRIVNGGGAVISEYPPGTPPLAGHFPGRNRIISGLCKGTLVVEAAEKSGSLITADFALEQGREVFAVPGPVYSPTSGGVNRLLKDGAHLVTSAEDILSVLWPRLPSMEVRRAEDLFTSGLSDEERKIYDLLGDHPLHIDDVARKSALTPMEVSAILLHLELRGGISALPGTRFVRGGRVS